MAESSCGFRDLSSPQNTQTERIHLTQYRKTRDPQAAGGPPGLMVLPVKNLEVIFRLLTKKLELSVSCKLNVVVKNGFLM